MRDHLKFRKPGDPRLIPLELTDYEQAIMGTFWQLSRDRSFVMVSVADRTLSMPTSIQLQTFKYYTELFQDPLNRGEIILLQQLDRTYLDVVQQLQRA